MYKFEDESTWGSYPHSYAVGHRNITELFMDEVSVEEKVDGSQFSFGVFRVTEGGGTYRTCLRMKSKGNEIDVTNPEKMFGKAVESVMAIADELVHGWTYRSEYLQKPKHNVLSYNRVPKNNLIIFDVYTGSGEYLLYNAKFNEANRLGLECVSQLYKGTISSFEKFKSLLNTESMLGGCNIEGVVIKNYFRTNHDKEILIGKYVSDAFKEKMSGAGHARVKNITECITDELGTMYRTEARWQKAVQHLKEVGKLDESPKDIGPLIRELADDIEKDSSDDIKDALWKWAWPLIRKNVTIGFAEWYKESLAKEQKFAIEIDSDDHL